MQALLVLIQQRPLVRVADVGRVPGIAAVRQGAVSDGGRERAYGLGHLAVDVGGPALDLVVAVPAGPRSGLRLPVEGVVQEPPHGVVAERQVDCLVDELGRDATAVLGGVPDADRPLPAAQDARRDEGGVVVALGAVEAERYMAAGAVAVLACSAVPDVQVERLAGAGDDAVPEEAGSLCRVTVQQVRSLCLDGIEVDVPVGGEGVGRVDGAQDLASLVLVCE